MITVIDDMPAGTFGLRGEGEVGAEDLGALAPLLREAIATGEVRILLVGAPGFDASHLRGLIGRRLGEVLGTDLGHRRDWKRIAIVTDSRWARHSRLLWSRFVPAQTRLFELDEEAAARAWLTED